MQLSAVRRVIGAGAVVAVTAGLLAAPSVQATPAEQSVDRAATTSLSIRIAKARIEPGQAARVSGHLAVGGGTSAAGRTVMLEARSLGSTGFVPIAAVVTAANGGVSAVVAPEVTTRYRWHFLGDTDTRPSRSGVAALRVRSKAQPARRLSTSLSIRKVFRLSTQGGIDIVRGQLRARRLALPQRPIILLSRAAGETGWAFEGKRNTHRHGVVKFEVDPSIDTAYRLVFVGSKRLRPARSGVVRVPQRADVAITVSPDRVTAGDPVTVAGVVTDAGVPVVGATVALWSAKAGTGPARRVVERGTTGADGSVVFEHLPKRSTKYRLRVVRGEGYGPAVSATILVIVTPAST